MLLCLSLGKDPNFEKSKSWLIDPKLQKLGFFNDWPIFYFFGCPNFDQLLDFENLRPEKICKNLKLEVEPNFAET